MGVELKDYTDMILRAVDEGALKGLTAQLVDVTAQAKALCPAITGNLRGSIGWKTERASGGFEKGESLREQVEGIVGIVGTPVEYAYSVETREGTAYLRPAVEICRGVEPMKAIGTAIFEEINRAGAEV